MPSLSLSDRSLLIFGDDGAGPPLVLVHGSPAEGRAWGRVAKHLQGFRLLTPDLPGYGRSDPMPGHLGTPGMADAVIAMIEVAARGAEGGPVWLAGHSYGGNVALHAALARREHVGGVVLFEPVFFRALALTGEPRELEAVRAHFDDYVRRVEGGDNGAVSRMIEFWFGAGAFERLPPPVRSYLTHAAPKNAADVKASFAEQLNAAELAAFDAPVLIAYGAASPPITAAIAAALTNLLPRAEAVPIAGATHAMLDTHAEAVAALIKRTASA